MFDKNLTDKMFQRILYFHYIHNIYTSVCYHSNNIRDLIFESKEYKLQTENILFIYQTDNMVKI